MACIAKAAAVRRYAREAELIACFAHLAGNAVTAESPVGHDVVLVSYVWRRFR
jgi:hypothetical protein